MTERVPAGEIERIVGRKRDPLHHWARAVSAEQTVYILHSEACRLLNNDLRDCPYSRALDTGIDEADWTQDVPVRIRIKHGRLVQAEIPA